MLEFLIQQGLDVDEIAGGGEDGNKMFNNR
jgi:hypothetical protein